MTSRPYATGGLGKVIIDSGQPLLLGSVAEKERLGRFPIASPDAARDLNESFLGVPLLRDGKAYGAASVQSYQRDAYGEDDVRLLQTLAGTMTVALENARLFDETQRLLKETEQRAAELAVINSIQEGMAAELDFQAIVDLVGDKLRRVLGTDDIGIRWFDAEAQVIHFLYEFEHGERLIVPSRPPASGGWDALVSERDPIVRNTEKEMAAMGTLPGTDTAKCAVQVPIIAGDRVIGRIIVENHEREYAFGESDVRLLMTVAATMGVALENARLFDETQRLLKETEQRNAELAVINSIQEGMAAELDFQTIIDLVGDKLREVLKSDDLSITWHDPEANLIQTLYSVEHGVRLASGEPRTPKPDGPFEQLKRARRPRICRNPAEIKAAGFEVQPGTDAGTLSLTNVPILGGDRMLGDITLESYEREDAFGEAEVRLVSTVAASMGVALENARLFDETQRLFKESEQRAAEMAVINSIQQGIAGELSFQAIIDLVGDKLRDVFKTSDMGIRWFDAQANTDPVPVRIRARRTHAARRHGADRGRRLVAHRGYAAAHCQPHARTGGGAQSRRGPRHGRQPLLRVRAHPRQRPRAGHYRHGGLRARIRVRRIRGAPAVHRRRQHGRRTGERAPLRRDAAAVEGERAARRRAGSHQQRAAGDGGRAQHAGNRRRGRRQAARNLPPG